MCRLEAAEPLQWRSLGCLVIGLLGPGLLQRHPDRVLPSQQPDQTAVEVVIGEFGRSWWTM